MGFQWADSPTNGAATIVVTDGDPAGAQRRELSAAICAVAVAAIDSDGSILTALLVADALALADYAWERRADWDAPHVTKEMAVADGVANGEYPIVIADQGDNTGGGDSSPVPDSSVEDRVEDNRSPSLVITF